MRLSISRHFGLCVHALLLCMLLMQPSGAFAADGTLFDPRLVEITARGAGIPVGTIVTWPVSTNPRDAENWLECDGRSTAGYPELAAIVGAKVPDYRGLFLRGQGGNADAVGVRQSDGINTSVPFELVMSAGEVGSSQYTTTTTIGGDPTDYTYDNPHAYKFLATQKYSSLHPAGYSPIQSTTTIQATIRSGSPETRPINMAVRYLIRARP